MSKCANHAGSVSPPPPSDCGSSRSYRQPDTTRPYRESCESHTPAGITNRAVIHTVLRGLLDTNWNYKPICDKELWRCPRRQNYNPISVSRVSDTSERHGHVACGEIQHYTTPGSDTSGASGINGLKRVRKDKVHEKRTKQSNKALEEHSKYKYVYNIHYTVPSRPVPTQALSIPEENIPERNL